MKTEKLEVLGCNLTYERASTSVETNALANNIVDGQQVDVANDRCWQYTSYHQLYGDLRKAATAFVVAKKFTTPAGAVLAPLTKTEVKTMKDGTKKSVLKVIESDEAFINRAVALGAVTLADLQTELQTKCNDPEWAYAKYLTETTRHVVPKGPTKDSQTTVQAWKDANVLDAKAASLAAKVGHEVAATDLIAVATALDEFKLAIVREAQELAKAKKREADAAAAAL